jgi:hypothetical protein
VEFRKIFPGWVLKNFLLVEFLGLVVGARLKRWL